MKNHAKKMLACFMTLAIFLSLFSGTISVSAMDLNQKYHVSWDHTLTDVDGNTFTWYGGIASDSNIFGHSYGNTTHTIHDYTVKRNGLTGSNTDWTYDEDYVYAFCIEPGVPLPNNTEYTGSSDPTHGDKWQRLSQSQQRLIKLVLAYGYPNRNGLQTSKDANACYAATQLLVWQCALNWRTSPTELNDRSYAMSGHSGTMTQQLTSNKYLKAFYDAILSDMAAHNTRPSFTGTYIESPVYELTQSGGQYKAVLTDTNGVLSDFYVADSAGLNVSISGNTMTITSNSPISNEKQIMLERRMPTTNMTTGFLCWSVNGKEGANQDMVTGVDNDPMPAYLKFKVSTGDLAIVKTSKNNGGQVSGFQFKVTKADGSSIGTYTSSADGRINIPNLVAGWYKVEEINLSDDFVKPTPNPVDIEIKAGQTATVSFNNIKKLGVISVQKTNANPTMGDYSLAGAEFEVRNSSGTVVDTIITGADGKGQSVALPLGSYTIKETKAPWGFVVDKNTYTRTLSGSHGTAEIVYCPEVVTIPEKPQVGQIRITKEDAETAGRAQGDATLSGAVFSVIDSGGNEVERLYCGSNISITSKEIKLDTYTVREITPPKGYTLSQKDYSVTIDYAGQEVEVNLKSTEVKNTVIKGKIAIIKHSDEPDVQVDPENEQVQQPLDNIIFRIYLKSALSYDNALPSERDEIVTNENGWAITKDLPYGIYVVEEIKGEPEHKVCEPFDAAVSEDGRTYYYNIENPAYYGKVKIIKVDSTTNKVIPQPNVEFKVRNTDTGKWVEQEILYPTPVTIRSYFTNSEGWLVMPQELKFGNYELVEIQSPYGYILSDKPVAFKVTSENPVAYLEVRMPNKPAMGVVTVEKQGEMLTGSTQTKGKNDEVYFIPKYEMSYLSGAVFNIIARSDIVTPDGTLRARAGDVVDTVTTKADGKATSKQLFLGDYYAIEVTTPYGFVLDTAEHDFSLVYVDQNTPIVTAQVGVFNERQKAEIDLTKICEIPEDAKKDYNPYNGVIFGLYAAEDIKTATGETVIPADSLMEYITFGKDGKAEVLTDLPFGSFYVQEFMATTGYILDDTKYDVIFDYAGQDTATAAIYVNGGNPVENKLMHGSLKVIKTFENLETPIPGIPFTITGQTLVGTTVTIEVITDENGEIFLEDLLVGEYTVKELASDLTVGYVLSDEQTLTVAADQIAEMTINNKLQRGDLKIIKTFEGLSTPIKGVKFTVTGTSLTGIPFSGEFYTDGNGEILIEGLPVGDYTVQEIASELTAGYVLSEEQTATVAADELAEMRIENKLIRGDIKIIKTDAATGKPLAGAKFGLYQNGELIAEDTTGDDGIAAFLNVPYGEYEIKEISAPAGYKKADTVFTASITENGKIITIEAENEKIPENPDIPQTGDNSNVMLWLILAGASAASLVGLTVAGKRRKTNGGTAK